MSDWDAVVAAVTSALTGDTALGRARLLACWEDTGAADHAHRCVLAHYLADLETELDREVAWDRTALTEHAHVGDGDAAMVRGGLERLGQRVDDARPGSSRA